MKTRDSILRLALPAALALTTLAATAQAADEDREQCAGIVKAGRNDCATKTNACHSHVTVDGSPDAWIYVPKGTCERLVGAHVVHVTDPTPAAK